MSAVSDVTVHERREHFGQGREDPEMLSENFVVPSSLPLTTMERLLPHTRSDRG